MSSAVILSEKTGSFYQSVVSNHSKSNGVGDFERLPEEVTRKIFEEFLSLQEKACFFQVSSFCKIVLGQPWEIIRNQYLLPIEAFGNLERCKQILPMPQELLTVLDGEDGHLYFPFLKASWFRSVAYGREKVFPATYKGIEKASKLRGGLGYIYAWDQMFKTEDPCELQKMHWMLITKDVLLGSRALTYEDQVNFVQNWIVNNFSLREGFMIPRDPRDVVYALFYQHLQSGIKFYSDRPWTRTFCQKIVDDSPVTVGPFAPVGLVVFEFDEDGDDSDIGVGVLRKF